MSSCLGDVRAVPQNPVMLIRLSQYLYRSTDAQKALCVYEGLSQLDCGDCECVQTGICSAAQILKKKVLKSRKVKCLGVVWEIIGRCFVFVPAYCAGVYYIVSAVCFVYFPLPVHNELNLSVV